jgi:hypothetical protein
VIPDRSHRAFVVSIPVRHKHAVLSERRRVNGATPGSAPCQIHPLTGSEGLSLAYL